jgi:hypothetical protein
MGGSDLVRISRFATSQLLLPRSRASTYETPIHDPTCRSDGSPATQIQRLPSSSLLASRDLEYQMLGPLPCEPPSSRDPWISATCPPRMDGSDPLVASPFATWSIQPLDSYLANLRVHEIPGSLPPVLLGWTALILSWLRHSRLGASNLWTPTSRTSEFTRSLDLCHLSSSDGRLGSFLPLFTRLNPRLSPYRSNDCRVS